MELKLLPPSPRSKFDNVLIASALGHKLSTQNKIFKCNSHLRHLLERSDRLTYELCLTAIQSALFLKL